MNKILYALVFILSIGFAEIINEESSASADCIILEDENSIVCKYEHERIEEDKEVIFQWINPLGEISRLRNMILPAGHGSVYDYRYKEGRMKGTWQFKVIDNKVETFTTFKIQ